jgi:hypothetical protein
MEPIDDLELKDEQLYPDDAVLKKVLGRSFGAYQGLLKIFEANDMTHEWRYYRDGKAWLCKVQKKKKTIIWMSARTGFVKAGIYVPVQHLDELLKLDIDQDVKERIKGSKNIMKSRPCVFDVKNKAVLKDLETVMKFKSSLK